MTNKNTDNNANLMEALVERVKDTNRNITDLAGHMSQLASSINNLTDKQNEQDRKINELANKLSDLTSKKESPVIDTTATTNTSTTALVAGGSKEVSDKLAEIRKSIQITGNGINAKTHDIAHDVVDLVSEGAHGILNCTEKTLKSVFDFIGGK